MTSPFRIAHISDTHISPEYDRKNILRLKTILAQVADEAFDHVVITGDITGQGELRGYRSIRRLLKHFDLLDYDKLSVTIGNHDIFGGVHRAEDIFTFGQHCRTVNYARQLSLFEKGFRETFPKKAYSKQNLFPYVKTVGPAAIIGVNSIREFHALYNPVGSNGYVTRHQLEEVEKILSHPSLAQMKKIVLIHHHFNKFRPHTGSFGATLYQKFESQTLKLYGRKDVEEVFKAGGVDVVLHGHTHIEGLYSRSGISFSSAALNPIRAKNDNELSRENKQLRFNEISIAESGEIEIFRRQVAVRAKGSSSRELERQFQGN